MKRKCAPRSLLRMPPAFFAVFSVFAFALSSGSASFAGEVISTPTRTVGAVMQAEGFSIRPVGINPADDGDLAPRQLFEIARPEGKSVTIGRMFTSCSCIRLEADARSFDAGEEAVLRLRNIEATPPSGQTYSFFVQITAPVKTTLRYDTFIQSSQFIPSDDVNKPTRGNIIADGVLDENALVSLPKPSVRMGSVIVPGDGNEDGDAPEDAPIEIIIPNVDSGTARTPAPSPAPPEKSQPASVAPPPAPAVPATPASVKPAAPAAPSAPLAPAAPPIVPPAPSSVAPPPAPPAVRPAQTAPATPPPAPGSDDSDDPLWQEVRPRTRLTPPAR